MSDEANKPATEDLGDWRRRIDTLDAELVKLLNQRAECARHIGAAKREQGGAIFVPHREQEVLKRMAELNGGPMPEPALRVIWREIMSASLALERPLPICHCGQPGAFTHLAAKFKFGESVSFTPIEDIMTVFTEVEKGHAAYG